jgi:hypothetical protein
MSSNANPEEASADAGIATALAECMTSISGLSAKGRLQVLKGLGGMYGHRVLPGTGPLTGPSIPSKVKDIKVPSAPNRPSCSPAKQEFKKRLNALNALISTKGKDFPKGILPPTDPLLIERDRLFRDFQKAQNKGDDGESPSKPQEV